jgi:multicomponent Na+:H+ antiporter subunit B
MKAKKIAPLLVIFSSLVAISYATASQALGAWPQTDLRNIASFYLKSATNPQQKDQWAASPEVVTAVVWDYRGLDTLFETSVFFFAIISCLVILRGISSGEPRLEKDSEQGLSPIVKVTTKIIGLMIVSVSASIALHGQLTPGGGFQAGAALAVLPILFIMAMSRFALTERGVNENSMRFLRSLGLFGIGITVLLPLASVPLINGLAYIMQNQIKYGSQFSFPSIILDRMMGGSLLIFNILEYLAVAAGFTLAFLLLSAPEESVKKILEEERYATH